MVIQLLQHWCTLRYYHIPPQPSWSIGFHSEWYNADDNRNYQAHRNIDPERRHACRW